MKKVSTFTAYFSHSGNSLVVAEKIHGTAGGEIFEIVSWIRTRRSNNAVMEKALKEPDLDYRP